MTLPSEHVGSATAVVRDVDGVTEKKRTRVLDLYGLSSRFVLLAPRLVVCPRRVPHPSIHPFIHLPAVATLALPQPRTNRGNRLPPSNACEQTRQAPGRTTFTAAMTDPLTLVGTLEAGTPAQVLFSDAPDLGKSPPCPINGPATSACLGHEG